MTLKEILVHFDKGPLDVGLQPFGRFVGDFDRVLQHGDGELGGRHGGQVEPEARLRLVRLATQVGHDQLEAHHPRRRQVAVLCGRNEWFTYLCIGGVRLQIDVTAEI